MVVFTALTWAASALMPGFAGSLSLFGLSPAVTAGVISVGRSALWSMAGTALTQPKVPLQQVQATISQADAPRIRAYGRNLLGGQRAFFENHNGTLHQIVVMHHGQLDSLITFWIDGRATELDTAGNVLLDPISPDMSLFFRDGSGNGGDYSLVRDAFPDLWTTAHRLQGQATFLARMYNPGPEQFSEVWPKGSYTVIQAEVRGTRVRNLMGEQVYSENAGLCLQDFMTSTEGWNIPLARLDHRSWESFVNLCDQPVPLAAGGVEPRYRLCGTYSLDDALKDTTGRMLACCDGQVYETAEGMIGILGGAWSEPDVTITASDILSIEMQDGYDPFSTYNVLRGSFVSPAHRYQPIEVEPRQDEIALETQGERSEMLDVALSPSGAQLQRLMKIRWAKDHREHIGTIRTNLVGLKARFPRGDGIHTIRIVADEFGLNGVFEVTSHVFSIPDGFCEIGIASIENPYGWDAASEEKPLPPTANDLETPGAIVPPPANALVVQQIVDVTGGVNGVKLVVTVDEPDTNGLVLQAQVAAGSYTADASALWVEMASANYRAETGVLDDGQTYTVRVRWRGRRDWVVAGIVTAIANPTAPAAPTSFTAIATGPNVSLDWINPSDEFFRTQIYRNTTVNFATATLIATVPGVAGKVSDYVDSPSGTGQRRYWAVSINQSRLPSAPAGPATVTISP